jgi:hypothetical protein
MADLKSLGKNEHGNIWAQWSFPEFVEHQRGLGWIIFMAILSLGLIIWAFWTANILFAFIIIIIAIIVILQARREPLEIKFQITNDGVQSGSNFYEWKRIEKFWIIYKPPEIKKLYFKLNSILPPSLSIPLEKENPIKIREILLNYALEDLEKDEESFSDFLGRSLKI